MKRKRLVIQLSGVLAVLVLGGVALYIGLQSAGGAKSTGEPIAEQDDGQGQSRPPSMIPDDTSLAGDEDSISAAVSGRRPIADIHVPSPDETVVRGNDDQSPARPPASRYFDATPAGGQFVTSQADDRVAPRSVTDQDDSQEPSRFVGEPVSSSVSDQYEDAVQQNQTLEHEQNVVDPSDPANRLRSPVQPSTTEVSESSSPPVDRFAVGAVEPSSPTTPANDASLRSGQFQSPPDSRDPVAPGAFRSRAIPAQSGSASTITSPAQPMVTGPPQGQIRPTGDTVLPPVADASGPAVGQRPLAADGVPGARELEGAQAPSLVIEKIAPDEIQVGIPATFEIRVRNVGRVDAQNVLVTDQVPRGTRLVEASSNGQLHADGSITWELETVQPGGETTLNMQVMPLEEGEIGSVASISFQAQASMRTICTKPELQLRHTAPAKVLIGQNVSFTITLSNPGSGAATDVILEEDVPTGLIHDAGSELEYQVGTLRPGETKQLELTLRAAQAGIVRNTLRLRANGNLSVQDELELEVIAPLLQVELDGPALRYLDRKAMYSVSVANPGTAPAKNVELIAYLPKGFDFQSTDNEGFYDAQRHAVLWSLEELPPQQVGDVRLELVPKETGEQKIRLEGRADLELNHVFEKTVVVDARPELQFSINDSADPIEVGSETMYEVRVTNAGAKTATNVRLAAAVPPGLKLARVDGPTRGTVSGQQVLFEPLARLAPGANVVYQIQASGVQAGDHRIQIQIANDDSQAPITQEESTRVYQDQ